MFNLLEKRLKRTMNCNGGRRENWHKGRKTKRIDGREICRGKAVVDDL